MRARLTLLMLSVAAIGTLVLLAAGPGLRADLLSGAPATIVVGRASVLIVASLLLVVASLREARPGAHVGLIAAAGVTAILALPVVALLEGPMSDSAMDEFAFIDGCIALSFAGSMIPLAVIGFWLRRGAVTRPRRASVLAGLAAGSIGTGLYSFTCPSQQWLFAGIAYPAAVFCVAAIARIILPRFLRW